MKAEDFSSQFAAVRPWLLPAQHDRGTATVASMKCGLDTSKKSSRLRKRRKRGWVGEENKNSSRERKQWLCSVCVSVWGREREREAIVAVSEEGMEGGRKERAEEKLVSETYHPLLQLLPLPHWLKACRFL